MNQALKVDRKQDRPSTIPRGLRGSDGDTKVAFAFGLWPFVFAEPPGGRRGALRPKAKGKALPLTSLRSGRGGPRTEGAGATSGPPTPRGLSKAQRRKGVCAYPQVPLLSATQERHSGVM